MDQLEPGPVTLKSRGLCSPSTQTKLAASSVLPTPAHRAVLGYGQSGGVRTPPPLKTREAMVLSGATSFSTQFTSASKTPAGFGPAPPAQCPTPGAINSLAKSSTCFQPPLALSMR